MKKLLLILSLFIAVTFSFQQCKAQVNHLFWAHNNNEFAGYGLLYNWYAASDANFAPTGWHVPTMAEYRTLRATLDPFGTDDTNIAGGMMKEDGLQYWGSDNASNSSGFSARGSGIRSETNGVFGSFRTSINYITTTAFNASYIYSPSLGSSTTTFICGSIIAGNARGMSVRLIKDDSTDPGTLTDYDGNVYKTVKIGDQVWIASNWKCTHLNNGTSITNVTDNTTWSGLTTGAWCYYNNNSKYK